MRINFNHNTGKLFKYFDIEKQGWLLNLINKFYQEIDVDPDYVHINKLISHHDGIRDLVNWLVSIGYKATYWETKFIINDEPFAFGIDFAEDCPLFIEIKLKQNFN